MKKNPMTVSLSADRFLSIAFIAATYKLTSAKVPQAGMTQKTTGKNDKTHCRKFQSHAFGHSHCYGRNITSVYGVSIQISRVIRLPVFGSGMEKTALVFPHLRTWLNFGS